MSRNLVSFINSVKENWHIKTAVSGLLNKTSFGKLGLYYSNDYWVTKMLLLFTCLIHILDR